MKARYIVFCFGLLAPGLASADCTYNGTVYAEGTVIGPYVCSNNQWVQR